MKKNIYSIFINNCVTDNHNVTHKNKIIFLREMQWFNKHKLITIIYL